MAYKINEDLYIGNTNKQLKDLLNGDTLPIGAIVDFDGSTIPDGYVRYVDPDVMSETILFNTNTWDSMMKRYETKNIDFTPYTYVEVHFTGQGGTNATNTILKIDLTKPFKSVITNSSVSYSYGASVCFPDIQLLQGSNNDPGIFRIGACISTNKKKIWMGDAGYFTGQTDSGNFDADTKYNRISKIVGFKPTIRIKKTQQPSDYPSNQIHDDYSTSTTDTYSCNYLNKQIENISYCKMRTNFESKIISSDSTLITGWESVFQSGDIVSEPNGNRIKVTNTSCLRLSGQICGRGNCWVRYKIYQKVEMGPGLPYTEEEINDSGMTSLYQLGQLGNGYWSAPLPNVLISLSKEATYYIYVYVASYNGKDMDINNGFGKRGTYICAEKIK